MNPHLSLNKKCSRLLNLGAILICAMAFMPMARAANILFYNFENQTMPTTVVDVSGSGNNGTFDVVGGATQPTFTNSPVYAGTGAGNFNGPNTLWQIVQVSNTINYTGDFTISLFLNPSALADAGHFTSLFSNGSNGNTDFFAFMINDGKLLWYHPGTVSAAGTLSINLNQWNQLAIVKNSTTNTFQMYVNGVADTSGSDGAIATNNTSYIGFGGFGGGVSFGINGYLDNVQVFNTALTQSEVQALAVVPEPSTIAMLGFGGIGGLMLVLRGRRGKV